MNPEKQSPLNIPILIQRIIDQRYYKQSDFCFQINLSPLKFQLDKNKDPQQTVIKKLYIKSTTLIFSYEKKPINRLMAILGNKSPNDFLFLSFETFNTDRKYARLCLNSQIIINGQKYNFLGYSKPNLRQFSCYFYKNEKTQIIKLFNSLGDFDQIYSVSKKAARLSLLYSSSNFICQLQNEQIRTIKDLKKNDVCFTDGCGYISLPLARKIKWFIKQIKYLPSVYQIRIKGIKGIVLLNPDYQDQQLIVRQSMIKFNAKQDKLKQLVLLNYSKPIYYGSINQQIIMLLAGLGIHQKYFLEMQENYIKLLKQAIIDPVKAVWLLKFLGKQQIISKILSNHKDMVPQIKSIISEQIYKNIKTKDLKNKLKIPLYNARFLYGAVYPELPRLKKNKLALKQDQIFLRVTTNKQVIETIIGTVIVTKNPCYYSGDIRILKAVDISEDFPFVNNLVNVIIFSTEGNTPLGSTISGSDYDGDEYFVCWDQNLIPKKEIKPYSYPMSPSIKKTQKVTQKDLIGYFVYFNRSIVGKINNRFQTFANISQKGVQCKECIQLGTELFSKAIDSINTGQKVVLPDELQNPNKSQIIKPHVWNKMIQKYNKFFQDQFKFDDQIISNWIVTPQMMLSIIQTYISSESYDDYRLFKIIKSWYMSKKIKNYQLFKYVDFSELTKEQKREIKDLPNFPEEYLGNPFQFSPIFSNYLFQKNGISFHTYKQSPKKWRSFYKTKSSELQFQIFEEALTKFNNILIGFYVNQDVRLVLLLSNINRIPYTQNQIPSQCLKAFYLGYNQYKRAEFYKDYKLYYSDQLFQIYQKERSNSFLWFKNNQISVDLNRFDRKLLSKHPRITKQTIKYLQVFVGLSENFKQRQIKKLYLTQQQPLSQMPKKQQIIKQQPNSQKKKVKYISKQQHIETKPKLKKHYISKQQIVQKNFPSLINQNNKKQEQS